MKYTCQPTEISLDKLGIGTPILTPHMALLLHFQGFPPIRTGQIFIPSDKGFKVKITTENL